MMLNQINCSQPSINFPRPNPMKLLQQRERERERGFRHLLHSGRTVCMVGALTSVAVLVDGHADDEEMMKYWRLI